MENEVHAHRDGVVRELSVEAGQAVDDRPGDLRGARPSDEDGVPSSGPAPRSGLRRAVRLPRRRGSAASRSRLRPAGSSLAARRVRREWPSIRLTRGFRRPDERAAARAARRAAQPAPAADSPPGPPAGRRHRRLRRRDAGARAAVRASRARRLSRPPASRFASARSGAGRSGIRSCSSARTGSATAAVRATDGRSATRSASEPSRAGSGSASHVGGDRFAGNLVCLPDGLYFGRVGPDDVARPRRRYLDGRIRLDLYRGRSCYSFPVQAAEAHVREATGLTGLNDLRLVGVAPRRAGTLGGGASRRASG